MTTGWTFKQGSVGEEVEKDVTIYSSQSCLSIIRTGGEETTSNEIDKTTASNPEDFAEEVVKKSAEDEEYEAALAKYNEDRAFIQSNISSASQTGFNHQLWCMNYVKKAYKGCAKKYGEGTPECEAAYQQMLKENQEYQRHLKEVIDWLDVENAEQEKLNKLDEDFQKKWGAKTKTQVSNLGTPSSVSTPAMSGGAITSVEPPILAVQAEQNKELEDLNNKIKNSGVSTEAAQGFAAWLDAMEQYIDNMPQYSENTSPLYEVELKGTKWFYTGNSAIPDPEFNKKIREFKQAQCQKLNTLIADATAKAEKILNDLSKKLGPIMPMITAINTIKGGLSISTIVDWGKAAISMFTSIYEMFYNTYKSVMEMMELVAVRFPQLISKMMDKVTELDCPVEMKSIHVNVIQNATEANREREAKKKQKKQTSGGIAGDDTTTA